MAKTKEKAAPSKGASYPGLETEAGHKKHRMTPPPKLGKGA